MVLLILILYLQPLFASTPRSISFSRLLRTNQYLIISQHLCQTTFESSIKDNTCPRAFAHIPKRSQKSAIACDYPIRVHLLRDPEQKRPPRALYIGKDFMARSIAFVEDIQVPAPSAANYTSVMYSRFISFSNRTHKHLNMIETEFTLYDQSYQLLYLISRIAVGTLHCTVFRLLNLFPGNDDPLMFDIRYVNNFEMHSLNKVRTGWMEDPYSGSVFYATANGGITSIYTLPMNRLLSALQDGVDGKRVFSFDSSTRAVISISGGLLFSQHSQGGYNTIYIRCFYFFDIKRTFANDSQHSVGLSCGFSGNQQTTGDELPISIVTVRDWDYCQLRDGPLAEPLSCSVEKEQWMVKEGMVVESGSLWSTALVIVLIMLSTLLLLLILHIFWLRRNLDDTFEEVQEAANFRYPSYVGQYPDMDISVDRWNY